MKSIASALRITGWLIACCFAGNVLAASKQGNNAAAQGAKQQVSAAQDRLRDARKALGPVQRELEKAQADQRAVGSQVGNARKEAAQKLAAKYKIPALVAERDAARKQVESARNAVDARVKGQPDWQEANRTAEAARQQYAQIEGDKSLTAETRQGQLTDLAAVIRKPAELQRAAADADADLKAATERSRKADKDLLAAETAMQKEIDGDPDVKAALEKVQSTQAAVKKASGAVAEVQREISSTQAAVDREQQEYQQERRQEMNRAKKK